MVMKKVNLELWLQYIRNRALSLFAANNKNSHCFILSFHVLCYTKQNTSFSFQILPIHTASKKQLLNICHRVKAPGEHN